LGFLYPHVFLSFFVPPTVGFVAKKNIAAVRSSLAPLPLGLRATPDTQQENLISLLEKLTSVMEEYAENDPQLSALDKGDRLETMLTALNEMKSEEPRPEADFTAYYQQQQPESVGPEPTAMDPGPSTTPGADHKDDFAAFLASQTRAVAARPEADFSAYYQQPQSEPVGPEPIAMEPGPSTTPGDNQKDDFAAFVASQTRVVAAQELPYAPPTGATQELPYAPPVQAQELPYIAPAVAEVAPADTQQENLISLLKKLETVAEEYADNDPLLSALDKGDRLETMLIALKEMKAEEPRPEAPEFYSPVPLETVEEVAPQNLYAPPVEPVERLAPAPVEFIEEVVPPQALDYLPAVAQEPVTPREPEASTADYGQDLASFLQATSRTEPREVLKPEPMISAFSASPEASIDRVAEKEAEQPNTYGRDSEIETSSHFAGNAPTSRSQPTSYMNSLSRPPNTPSYAASESAEETKPASAEEKEVAQEEPSSTPSYLSQLRSEPKSKPEPKTVEVESERFLLKVTPEQAKQAFLNYVWEDGGGLPNLVLKLKRQDGVYTKRILFPTLTEERLTDFGTENRLDYKVSKWGAIENDMVKDSHTGTVEFEPIENGTLMKWKVKFDTYERYNLWKRVTAFLVGTASDNLVSYLTNSQTILHERILPGKTKEVMDAWVSFVWKQGGELFLIPKPINLGGGQRVIPPLFIRERLQSVDYDKNEIIYKVENPSLLTYPVHEHLGTVQFEYDSDNDSTTMLWRVQVQPYHNFEIPVNVVTSATITSLSLNLRSYLIEKPPSKRNGNADSMMSKGFSLLIDKAGGLVKGSFAAVEDQQLQRFQNIQQKMDDSVAQVLQEAEEAEQSAAAATSTGATPGLFFAEKKKSEPRPTLVLEKSDLPKDDTLVENGESGD
jgi:hypothetical protein